MMQGIVRGVLARNSFEAARECKEVEVQCQEAIEAKSKFALETALTRASEVGLKSAVVATARSLLDQVSKDSRVRTPPAAAGPAAALFFRC